MKKKPFKCRVCGSRKRRGWRGVRHRMQLFCSVSCLNAYERALGIEIYWRVDATKDRWLWRHLSLPRWDWAFGPMLGNRGFMKRRL